MNEKTVPFKPVFKGEIEGYVSNFLRKNFWRVARSLEYQDVMQEAYVTFLDVEKRYAGTVDNPSWFMALYKKAWHDSFYELAYSSSKTAQECHADTPKVFEKGLNSASNYGPLLAEINSAPAEIRNVLNILFTAPAEMLAVVEQELRASSKKTCGINKMLCKLVGADPMKVNLKNQLLEYLST